jgi:hypothetical protein
MDEIWEDIKGYEGRYQVSNMGRVKGLEKVYFSGANNKFRKVQPESILAGGMLRGYLGVLLYADGGGRKGRKTKTVHRLVANAFIENPLNCPEINHKDGNKLNNCVDNLEWVTSKQNTLHAIENNLRHPSRGTSHGSSKLNESCIRIIRKLYHNCGYTQQDIANVFQISRENIGWVVRNQSWTHVN